MLAGIPCASSPESRTVEKLCEGETDTHRQSVGTRMTAGRRALWLAEKKEQRLISIESRSCCSLPEPAATRRPHQTKVCWQARKKKVNARQRSSAFIVSAWSCRPGKGGKEHHRESGRRELRTVDAMEKEPLKVSCLCIERLSWRLTLPRRKCRCTEQCVLAILTSDDVGKLSMTGREEVTEWWGKRQRKKKVG
jgi:hypothetical protein